jgi:hypothetical protein
LNVVKNGPLTLELTKTYTSKALESLCLANSVTAPKSLFLFSMKKYFTFGRLGNFTEQLPEI